MLIYYLVFFFLILRFTITLFNFISNPKLTNARRTERVLVSILVPVRNESVNIGVFIKSVLDQEYENFELIIIDDDSDDNTYQLCKSFEAVDDRIRVFRSEVLAPGWSGKAFACHQLAAHASGRFLFFLDANTRVRRAFINNCVHRLLQGRLALLSIFPDQVMATAGLRMIVPLLHYLLLSLIPLRLTRMLPGRFWAIASGQCMIFDAFVYKSQHWHSEVRDKIADDRALVRLVKLRGYRAETLLANACLLSVMYTDSRNAFRGFSKNIFFEFNRNIAALICFLLLVVAGPLFIIFRLDLSLIMFALALIVLMRLMISLQCGENALLNILLHPFHVFVLVLLCLRATRNYWNGIVEWRGRKVPTSD